MESNPYSSPSANLFGSTGSMMAEGVTQGVINQLQRTRPWVIFMSVIAFLGTLFMVAIGAVMALGGAMMGNQPGMPSWAMPLLGGFYALMGLFYLYPGIKLWKYGSRISALARTRTTADLEAALDQQRGFWKFVSIMTIVIFVLAMALPIVIGVVGATSRM